jgi:hypothetical protein
MEIAAGMRVLLTEINEKGLDLTNGSRGEIVDIILDSREPRIDNGASIVPLQYLPRCLGTGAERAKTHVATRGFIRKHHPNPTGNPFPLDRRLHNTTCQTDAICHHIQSPIVVPKG